MFICFVHVNLNCLTNKVEHVKNVLVCNDVDVLGVSESWLNSEIDDAIIQIPGFVSVRCDSSSGVRKHGVLVYVRNSLKFEVITSHVPNLICIYLIDFRLY